MRGRNAPVVMAAMEEALDCWAASTSAGTTDLITGEHTVEIRKESNENQTTATLLRSARILPIYILLLLFLHLLFLFFLLLFLLLLLLLFSCCTSYSPSFLSSSVFLPFRQFSYSFCLTQFTRNSRIAATGKR